MTASSCHLWYCPVSFSFVQSGNRERIIPLTRSTQSHRFGRRYVQYYKWYAYYIGIYVRTLYVLRVLRMFLLQWTIEISNILRMYVVLRAWFFFFRLSSSVTISFLYSLLINRIPPGLTRTSTLPVLCWISERLHHESVSTSVITMVRFSFFPVVLEDF